MVKKVSDQDFHVVLPGSGIPLLVAFWAPWCSPCRMVSPVIEKLSTAMQISLGF